MGNSNEPFAGGALLEHASNQKPHCHCKCVCTLYSVHWVYVYAAYAVNVFRYQRHTSARHAFAFTRIHIYMRLLHEQVGTECCSHHHSERQALSVSVLLLLLVLLLLARMHAHVICYRTAVGSDVVVIATHNSAFHILHIPKITWKTEEANSTICSFCV